MEKNSGITQYILDIRATDNNKKVHIHYNNNAVYDINPYVFDFSDSLSGMAQGSSIQYSYTGDFRWQYGQFLDAKMIATDRAGNSVEVHAYWYGNSSNATDKWPY